MNSRDLDGDECHDKSRTDSGTSHESGAKPGPRVQMQRSREATTPQKAVSDASAIVRPSCGCPDPSSKALFRATDYREDSLFSGHCLKIAEFPRVPRSHAEHGSHKPNLANLRSGAAGIYLTRKGTGAHDSPSVGYRRAFRRVRSLRRPRFIRSSVSSR